MNQFEKSKLNYYSYILLTVLVITELTSQLGTWLLGIAKLATPLTIIDLLRNGFFSETLIALALSILFGVIIYGFTQAGTYRKVAFVALSLVCGSITCFVLGYILFNAICEDSPLSIEHFCLFFLSRFEYPLEWARFIAYEEMVFFSALIGFALLAIDRFKSPSRAVKNTDFATSQFGTAAFADYADLKAMHAYQPTTGPIIGQDERGALYLPLLNKLTISPPGFGKTTASSIPALLSYDGPVFAFDVKGELWAVTACYRTEVMGRHVVAIDPFGITQTPDFQQDKPDGLKTVYHFNPFDFVPEDSLERDRMINSFSSSFVINEGGYSNHFDENAKILIRGYIDYLMSRPKAERTLPALFQLMSESFDEANATFEEMAQCNGRAGAAANQISRVGSDERGSILSTSYRQIDWIGDRNIQHTLSDSNFDLADFIRGNMDLFVILPVDQTKEHSRLFRMTMSLLMNLIVTTPPSQLPPKKMLFLLEELAQLGACPDVEQCIEVMRARGVVVWSVFQSLKQIKLFSKPDLFLSVPIKQVFTNDDVETMQWIQSLGGKKTVITKSLSTNKGDSMKKMAFLDGQQSEGESASVQETGVDLIQLNEIRELPIDEQFVFIAGGKPIRCKKARYFEHRDFVGKFDKNPVERA